MWKVVLDESALEPLETEVLKAMAGLCVRQVALEQTLAAERKGASADPKVIVEKVRGLMTGWFPRHTWRLVEKP